VLPSAERRPKSCRSGCRRAIATRTVSSRQCLCLATRLDQTVRSCFVVRPLYTRAPRPSWRAATLVRRTRRTLRFAALSLATSATTAHTVPALPLPSVPSAH
jgi:hypothetical protein